MQDWVKILKWLALAAVIIAFGCEDTRYSTKPRQRPGTYPLETEISLSPDGQYIYFLTTDTITPANSGIYRARLSNPVREKLVSGNTYRSPVVSFDNQRLAFLESGRIKYFPLGGQSIIPSALPDSFESIIFINDSQLVAHRDTTLYLVDESRTSVTLLCRGWDPTFLSRGSFLYIGGNRMNYRIMSGTVFGDTALLQTVATDAVVHWATKLSSFNRIAYGVEWFDQRYIYSVIPGQDFTYIDSSLHSKPYLAAFDMILFTGADGRIYSSDFAGELSVPFVPEAGGNTQ